MADTDYVFAFTEARAQMEFALKQYFPDFKLLQKTIDRKKGTCQVVYGVDKELVTTINLSNSYEEPIVLINVQSTPFSLFGFQNEIAQALAMCDKAKEIVEADVKKVAKASMKVAVEFDKRHSK